MNLLRSCNFNLFDVNQLLSLFDRYSFVQKDVMVFLVRNRLLSDRQFVSNFFRNLLLTDTEKGALA